MSFHFLENINYIYKSQKHKPTSGTEITPFNMLQKNLITSNSWNLFTTVIWNINYDNVLTSFVTCFSKAWQFSFWSWCNICFVTWRISLPFFLVFVFWNVPRREISFSPLFVNCFPHLPCLVFFFPPPHWLLIQEMDFSAYAAS